MGRGGVFGRKRWRRGGAVSVAVAVVCANASIVAFVLVNEFGRPSCGTAEKKVVADLYAAVSERVVSNPTTKGAPSYCDPGTPVTAMFDGPIADTDLKASYRRHATEVGWREKPTDTVLPAFAGTLPGGTPFTITVWTDKQIVAGVVPEFGVEASYSMRQGTG